MAGKLKFCGLHQIGYNTEFDKVCPQCLLSRQSGAKQYDFSSELGKPVDRSGKPLEDEAIVP